MYALQHPLVVWSCLALWAVWILQLVIRAFRSPLSSIPGPWYTTFTRLVLKFHTLKGTRMYYVDSLHQFYGPIVRISPHEVAVADPESVAKIHRIGSGFLKSSWYQAFNKAPEPGIFSMIDPKQHAQRRKLFAKAFSNASLKANWEPSIREKAELAVARIKDEAQRGEADVLKWWTLMATDVIGHLSFGESFGMLQIGQKTQYVRVLESALLSSGIRLELPWLHAIARLIPLESIQTVMKADDYLFEYGGKAVTNLRKQGGNGQNIFGNMLAACDGDEKQQLTDMSIRLEAGNLIVAGSDTTAITLTYLVWTVLKRPDLQRRVEAELGALDPAFGDAELERLPLLNAVIEEVLRLYGAAPGALPRTVPPGGVTFCGYFIPEGTVVETQAYTLHRNPSVFPNPLEHRA
ncbi:Cytochrome P450 [Coniochaeta hoffmannii]|uniref:Cytochrome P450 n=1 Tax=Coniochaeta hoffmannii TaxID=91930 RepID=A0AA38SEQ8_9PEZI|nr:Cytochrome P450 [Coniochaeta hoffmannii]